MILELKDTQPAAQTPIAWQDLHQAQTLGQPLPDDIHAVSVSMPRWQDVVDYEEGKPRIAKALRTAYPRFYFHPLVSQIFDKCEAKYCNEHEQCLVFPTHRMARLCADFILRHTNYKCGTAYLGVDDVSVVIFPKPAFAIAKSFWQHSGYGISSRLAESLLDGRMEANGYKAKTAIKARIADLSGSSAEHITLYPSGMAAIFTAYRLVMKRSPNAACIQLGFPYVDTLKILEKWERKCHFIMDNGDYLTQLETVIRQEKIAAVFTECPSNPLLKTIDLAAVSALLRSYNVPLIIDNTLSSWVNQDVSPYADITCTSLTKSFSGTGNVMAGSLILQATSPYRKSLDYELRDMHQDVLFGNDAIILEENSRDVTERMSRMNQTTETLCDHLVQHPQIAAIYYPKYNDKMNYDMLKPPHGGYGNIFSLILRDAGTAPDFYNALSLCKGPSLGTNFSLCCPYTLLAHYHELEWAASLGVDAHLIRVSVGLEDADDLIMRFDKALIAS